MTERKVELNRHLDRFQSGSGPSSFAPRQSAKTVNFIIMIRCVIREGSLTVGLQVLEPRGRACATFCASGGRPNWIYS